MATYGIVYGTVTKAIRRVITDDDGLVTIGKMPDGVTPAVICNHHAHPTSYHPLLPGESAIAVIPPNVMFPARPSDWVTAVRNATGVTPPNITCALIDGSNVVQQVINADPNIDAAPIGVTMVQCYSPKIGVGCSYDPATGKFSTPPGTIPPGAPGNPGSTPIIVLPVVI